MYGIFAYIWVIYGANVGKYSIHGSYGILNPLNPRSVARHSQAGTRARAARAWLWPFVMALVRYPAFLGRR